MEIQQNGLWECEGRKLERTFRLGAFKAFTNVELLILILIKSREIQC
jgi:hypothetical protein